MIEKSLAFGPSGNLVGTLCLPSPETALQPGVGLVMFNAGVVHRIGPHRINVRLARKLAEQGVASIRFDLSGQGDSGRPGEVKSARDQVVCDVGAAMDALASASGIDRFALFGFCSGGYNGYDVALADARVTALIMFDAYIYTTFKARLNRYIMRIQQHGFFYALAGWSWRSLASATGRIRAGFKRKNSMVLADPNAYLIGLPSRAEFATGLRTLLDRGVRVHMVYAGEGFEHFNYDGQFEDAFREYGISGKVTTKFFADMDHVSTGIAAQDEFISHIRNWTISTAGT